MSIKDYEGGIITKNPTTPTGPYQDGVASGVWTMDQAAEYTKQGVWPTAGNISPEQYVDGLFSTYLYEGNGTSQTITNNLDLDGEGGMVWIKSRPDTYGHRLIDTERGVLKVLESYDTNAEATQAGSLTAFNSNGFDVGNAGHTNFSGNDFVSWSFLKKPGFFDVVTYTGNSTSGRGIAHNLGSTPGFVIVKCTSDAEVWRCFHRTFSASDDVSLNSTAAVAANGHFPTVPDSDNFYVGAGNQVNGTGKTYVAYLFAHDDQRFGDNADESIIKCGSYTGTGSAGIEVNLGFEPQWIMFKRSDSTGDWLIYDVMRGIVTGGSDERLEPNTSDAAASSVACEVTATGFTVTSTGTYMNASGGTYIYIAIRRPMKTPTAATEVFTPALASSSGDYTAVAGFPVDMNIYSQRSSANNHFTYDRLRGGPYLATDSTSGEAGDFADWDSNTSFIVGGVSGDYSDYINWMFKRATGFFDVVAYTGDGAASQTLNHNLGVTPDIITVKKRSSSGSQWPILVRPTADSMYLNTNNAGFGAYYYIDNPTSTTFDVQTDGSAPQSNQSGETYIAYLFATLAGISKVGSYTGTAANLDVDCGFTSGARFILIKRTDSTGDWYVYDSVRGIVSGNDPYLLINTTDAEVTGTDYIDPLSSGFTVTSSAPAGLNASGGTYIFLAIA